MILKYGDINNVRFSTEHKDLLSPPGVEHYKLLSYLCSQISNAIIIDVGTHVGLSALSLSTNKTNTVYTFDIVDKLSSQSKSELWRNNNVIFNTDNLMDPEIQNKWKETILKSSMIFFDIDPHEGKDEYKFYLWLKEIDYKGIVIFDDIWYFKPMRDNFWYNIPFSEKYDVTMLGHWSGTGIVTFAGQKIEIYEKAPQRIPAYTPENKSWTVVTAYFNLTKTPDASSEIKQKNLEYYMKHSNMTMSLDQNLVVYCDKDSEPYLRKMRPSYLEDKTKFIILDFMDVDIVKQNYKRLVDVRSETKYNADSRNTPSYYLLCMARYDLLLRTMTENPFNSTHFCWCNICIERMSWKSGVIFPKIWQEFRDKFSTCYIDYQPKSLVLDNIQEYYKWGRCSMCSGFFTGNKYYFSEFCKEIFKAFTDMLDLKVGHADEQLFSIVFFRRPEIFEFYIGDYTEMIVNYGWVYDRAAEPVKNVIRNLYNYRENWDLLYTLTSRWLESFNHGCFDIDKSFSDFVKNIHEECKMNCKKLN